MSASLGLCYLFAVGMKSLEGGAGVAFTLCVLCSLAATGARSVRSQKTKLFAAAAVITVKSFMLSRSVSCSKLRNDST